MIKKLDFKDYKIKEFEKSGIRKRLIELKNEICLRSEDEYFIKNAINILKFIKVCDYDSEYANEDATRKEYKILNDEIVETYEKKTRLGVVTNNGNEYKRITIFLYDLNTWVIHYNLIIEFSVKSSPELVKTVKFNVCNQPLYSYHGEINWDWITFDWWETISGGSGESKLIIFKPNIVLEGLPENAWLEVPILSEIKIKLYEALNIGQCEICHVLDYKIESRPLVKYKDPPYIYPPPLFYSTPIVKLITPPPLVNFTYEYSTRHHRNTEYIYEGTGTFNLLDRKIESHDHKLVKEEKYS